MATHPKMRTALGIHLLCLILLVEETVSYGVGTRTALAWRPGLIVKTSQGSGSVMMPATTCKRTAWRLNMTFEDSNQEAQEKEGEPALVTNGSSVVDDTQAKKGVLSKIFGVQKIDRATLASLGTSVILSYGFVSNAFGCTAVSCAWYIASRRSGLSPLAPGQWKGFLTVYAGFFAFLNIIRPARFALSVYLSRYFEKAVEGMQVRFKCNKATAVGLVVFFVNFCGSLALISVGIATASALAGVPVWATKA